MALVGGASGVDINRCYLHTGADNRYTSAQDRQKKTSWKTLTVDTNVYFKVLL